MLLLAAVASDTGDRLAWSVVIAASFFILGQSRWYWLVAFFVYALSHATVWALEDNHKYAIWYAMLLMHVASRGHGRELPAGRLLISVIFLAAAIQKVVSPDFLAGDFFRHTPVNDERMLFLPPAYARPLSVVVVLFELAIGVAFLASGALSFRRAPAVALVPSVAANALLIAFLLVTYLVTPVRGFGMILSALGHVQASSARWQKAFSFCFVWTTLTAILRASR